MAFVKPFLKWPGGKYRVLKEILPRLPAGTRLVEPFAGSGAVFLNASFTTALLCDANADLINLYQLLQRCGERFIVQCSELFTPENNTPEAYYSLRARFNAAADPEERGMLFIYLNRHAYNGLVRYNSKGLYNAPFGRYKLPRFPLESLQHFSCKAKESDTVFLMQDFRQTFSMLQEGDVVYCDPPYVPLSRTANFTCYAGVNFSMEDQSQLAELACNAAQSGISVIISNHDTPQTRALYQSAQIECFPVRRSISCRGATRGPVQELTASFRAEEL